MDDVENVSNLEEQIMKELKNLKSVMLEELEKEKKVRTHKPNSYHRFSG